MEEEIENAENEEPEFESLIAETPITKTNDYTPTLGETAILAELLIKSLFEHDRLALIKLSGIADGIQQKRKLELDTACLKKYSNLMDREYALFSLVQTCQDLEERPVRALSHVPDVFWKETLNAKHAETLEKEIYCKPAFVSNLAQAEYSENKSKLITCEREITRFIFTAFQGTSILSQVRREIDKYLFAKRRREKGDQRQFM